MQLLACSGGFHCLARFPSYLADLASRHSCNPVQVCNQGSPNRLTYCIWMPYQECQTVTEQVARIGIIALVSCQSRSGIQTCMPSVLTRRWQQLHFAVAALAGYQVNLFSALPRDLARQLRSFMSCGACLLACRFYSQHLILSITRVDWVVCHLVLQHCLHICL